MDKYAVEEDDAAVKTSADATRCPACKTLLKPSDTVNVLVCPKCGTAPFEGKLP